MKERQVRPRMKKDEKNPKIQIKKKKDGENDKIEKRAKKMAGRKN